MMITRFLSVYLTKGFDYHKNVELKPDNFSYIEEYYKSIVENISKTKLSGTIIHDELSEIFIKHHTCSVINFTNANYLSNYSYPDNFSSYLLHNK